MTESEFEQYRSSLVGKILQQEEQLGDRSNRYWLEIDQGNYQFDSRERLATTIGQVTLAEFNGFFSEFVLGSNRPRLVVRSFGNERGALPEVSANQIVDPIEFRARRDRFPLPQD
jgi:secreted Zn-dependent insulinase-like peptidase